MRALKIELRSFLKVSDGSKDGNKFLHAKMFTFVVFK
jgi:hypothetical protein